MTIRMKALKSHTYAARRVKPGEEYNARGRGDAALMVALGRAQIVELERRDVPALLKATPVDAAVVEPGEATDAVSALFKPAAKRAYRRRDMTAEGSKE